MFVLTKLVHDIAVHRVLGQQSVMYESVKGLDMQLLYIAV